MKLHTVLFLSKAAIKFWRMDTMYRQSKEIAKKVGIGIAAGTAIAAIGVGVARNQNKPGNNMRKTAGKAVHTVGTVVSGLERMLR